MSSSLEFFELIFLLVSFLRMKVLSLRFAGFPVLHDGGTNATALILSSLLRFLGGNYHIVEDGSN